MSHGKRARQDENAPATPRNRQQLQFIDYSAPKKPRLSAKNARTFSSQDIQNYETQRAEEDLQRATAAALLKTEHADGRVEDAWRAISDLGFSSLHHFIHDLLQPPLYPKSSSFIAGFQHGPEILDLIRSRHPAVANDWALSTTRQLVQAEMEVLAQRFRPQQGTSIGNVLAGFSLQKILVDAEKYAPSLLQVLRQAGDATREYTSRKNPDLVYF